MKAKMSSSSSTPIRLHQSASSVLTPSNQVVKNKGGSSVGSSNPVVVTDVIDSSKVATRSVSDNSSSLLGRANLASNLVAEQSVASLVTKLAHPPKPA